MSYPPPMAWKTRYGSGAVFTYRNLIDPMIYPLRPRIVQLCADLGVRRVLDQVLRSGRSSANPDFGLDREGGGGVESSVVSQKSSVTPKGRGARSARREEGATLLVSTDEQRRGA